MADEREQASAVGKDENPSYKKCRLCPRECNADRSSGQRGVCGAGDVLQVARAGLHTGEEPCLSGNKGSGTIFFSFCNLKCVFCQNYRISQEHFGKEITLDRFAGICLELQEQGAHNINLVSPGHFTPSLREGLVLARQKGLAIPVVYNSNSYEKVETLKQLEGLIDIYLPDIKYVSPELSLKYSGVDDYFVYAAPAVLEMLRQVGEPSFDREGLLQKGLLVRHLLLPGQAEDSGKVLSWIAEHLPRGVYVSLMGQYTPYYRAECYPELSRTITRKEYREMIDFFFEAGLENGFVQDLESADVGFIPPFDLRGV